MELNIIEDPRPDQVSTPELRAFLEWWLALEKAHGRPARKHFTPHDLKDHLPNIMLIEFEPQSGRMKTRLAGTQIVEAIGREITGGYADDLPNPEILIARGKWLVGAKRPYYAPHSEMTWANKDFTHYGAVACPLFDNNGEVSMMVLRIVFMEGAIPSP